MRFFETNKQTSPAATSVSIADTRPLRVLNDLRFCGAPHKRKAFVEFCAETYDESHAEIVRTMVSKNVNADKSLKPDAFSPFVKNKIVAEIEARELRDELARE